MYTKYITDYGNIILNGKGSSYVFGLLGYSLACFYLLLLFLFPTRYLLPSSPIILSSYLLPSFLSIVHSSHLPSPSPLISFPRPFHSSSSIFPFPCLLLPHSLQLLTSNSLLCTRSLATLSPYMLLITWSVIMAPRQLWAFQLTMRGTLF